MKKQLIGLGLVLTLLFAATAVVYADPPTPHGEPPHGKPTEVPGLNQESGAGKGFDSESDAGKDVNPESESAKGGKRHGIFGTIKAIASPTFTVTTKQGDVVVTTTVATKFRIPTRKNVTFADLATGDRVSVNGTPSGGGLIAKQVAITPGKPTIQHRVGIVSAYTANSSITITDVRGGQETFALTKDTVIRGPNGTTIANGDRVTVVSRRDPGSTTFTATAIVVHPK